MFIKFNKNRSCIEINVIKLDTKREALFNKNRSCIEILMSEVTLLKSGTRLIKTEVVLKSGEFYLGEVVY